MRAPRILAVASAVDLDFRYGCTPAWWQLWKGLTRPASTSSSRRTAGGRSSRPGGGPRPTRPTARARATPPLRGGLARLKGDRYLRRAEESPTTARFDRLTRETIWRVVTPRWRRHLDRLVAQERPDAVLVFTVPMAHFRGIPTYLRERHGIPVVFYDGDVPMSLPEFGGMDTGFNYYHGADPSEYDLVLSNSEGGLDRLLELGARRAEAVLWGADPSSSAPSRSRRSTTSSSTATATSSAASGWRRSSASRRGAPRIDFALGGRDFQGDVGRARLVGDVPFNVFARAISAARINLNITRRSHATVDGSSTCRPFELAAAGAAIVSNPHAGLERWFEPERSCSSSTTPTPRSTRTAPARRPGQAEAMGARARERVLDEHTYAHRARQVLRLLGLEAAVTA